MEGIHLRAEGRTDQLWYWTRVCSWSRWVAFALTEWGQLSELGWYAFSVPKSLFAVSQNTKWTRWGIWRLDSTLLNNQYRSLDHPRARALHLVERAWLGQKLFFHTRSYCHLVVILVDGPERAPIIVRACFFGILVYIHNSGWDHEVIRVIYVCLNTHLIDSVSKSTSVHSC